MTRREQDDALLFRYHDGDVLTPEEHARVEELMEREVRKNRKRRPSGGQRTAAERQARRRQTIIERGLKLVRVIVPEAREAEIKEIARRMREK